MNLINFFFFTQNLKNLKDLIFTKGSERMWLPWQLGLLLDLPGLTHLINPSFSADSSSVDEMGWPLWAFLL